MPSTAPIFGWTALDTEVVGQSCHLLMPDPDQFILLAESERPMSSPGYDHLGLLQDSRQEVDDLLEACERYAEKDDRVAHQALRGPSHLPGLTVHAFYVKYLLPIYFDVQCMEHAGLLRRSPGRPRDPCPAQVQGEGAAVSVRR